MNLLPRALYGARAWPDALSAALSEGVERPLAGGEIDGRVFLVAAVLGAPALWAPAREAARIGAPGLAWRRARRALGRAFTGRLRYALDGQPRAKAEALVFLCPLVSRVLADEAPALEAAALDVKGAAEAFRLGVHALAGDWRADPAVDTEPCRLARVWAAGGIPALLDGESLRLQSPAKVAYRPSVARVLALPKDL
jgi:diacylglycerol kinase family enzyme